MPEGYAENHCIYRLIIAFPELIVCIDKMGVSEGTKSSYKAYYRAWMRWCNGMKIKGSECTSLIPYDESVQKPKKMIGVPNMAIAVERQRYHEQRQLLQKLNFLTSDVTESLGKMMLLYFACLIFPRAIDPRCALGEEYRSVLEGMIYH
jgi:hypothetical protein